MRLTLALTAFALLLALGCQTVPPPQEPQPAPPEVSHQQPMDTMNLVIATLAPPDNTTQAIKMIDWMIFRYENVHFEFDSFALSDEARSLLEQKADWIKTQDPDTQIIVTGHCDPRGTETYNKYLGVLRANAVKQYLVNCGVPFEQVRLVSAGAQQPLVEGGDESVWALNRRVEFLDR